MTRLYPSVKAMPVLLTTPEWVRQWLGGTREETLRLQKPTPDEEIEMADEIEKVAGADVVVPT